VETRTLKPQPSNSPHSKKQTDASSNADPDTHPNQDEIDAIELKIKDIYRRAKQSLIPKEHVGIEIQTAVLEFKYGVSEKGRTVFESIIANNFRRTDIL
jgi:hypothetical protein